MAARKKDYEEKYINIWVGFLPAQLREFEKLSNNRNELIRYFCDYCLKNLNLSEFKEKSIKTPKS